MQRAEPDFLRLEPGLRVQRFESDTSRVGWILEAMFERCADDALVFPPTGNLFELSMSFPGCAKVKVANKTKLFMEVAITERCKQGFAEAQRQRDEIGQ